MIESIILYIFLPQFFIISIHPVDFLVELLQLSDGRMVSPSPMERAVKNQLSCMSHCIACGQKKPYVTMLFTIEVTIHSFIQTISIAHLQVHYYSEALPTQHRYCAGVSRRSATGNCELRTFPRSLRGG